jgi:Transglycosylase SLT domain
MTGVISLVRCVTCVALCRSHSRSPIRSLIAPRENGMSNRGVHRGVRTISLPWRGAFAVLPAVALIGAGIAMAIPAGDVRSASASRAAPAIAVPGTALTMPPVPAGAGRQEAPGLALSAGTTPGSAALVPLDRTGIPARALEAYRRSASLVGAADPACRIDWALTAAIGRVESDHARFAGNQLDSAGVARPGIIGIRLDGTNNTARITDTDGGRLDRDTSYDRAVGPMQFIPGTWRVVGSDANGDGSKNPQDLNDAATATAVYLCSGPGDLRSPDDLRAAIMRYNPSDSYARTVTAIANAYRHGVSALPAADLPAASPSPSEDGAARTTARTARPARNSSTPRPSPPAGREPAVAAPAPATAPPTTSPPPIPAPPLPALPISRQGPTGSALPSRPAAPEICTVSTLGGRTCTIAPLG